MTHPRPWSFVLVALAGWIHRKQQDVIDYLREENRVLREQVGPKRPRLTDAQRRRLAVKGRLLGRKLLPEVATLVTPETILGWYRDLVARKYDGTRNRRPGRPSTPEEIKDLVVRMARENPRWGYTRIQGALHNLGHEIGRNTVKRILTLHGLEPAPGRARKTSWSTFLKSHAQVLAAADFFTVEILTLKGLARIMVFFVIDVATRRVSVAGVSADPHGRWMEQIARNLTDSWDGFLRGKRYFIHDRDSLFTKRFDDILESAGIHSLRLPARSPNLNAFAERFVRSIKTECLDRMIFVSERGLCHALEEFMAHYHGERNHQGLGNTLIDPASSPPGQQGSLRCRERLGGLLRYYTRSVA